MAMLPTCKSWNPRIEYSASPNTPYERSQGYELVYYVALS